MDFVFQRSYRGPLQAILWDWAGTTMDYGCYAPAVVFTEVYKRQGVPITIEEARIPAYERMAKAGAHYVVDGIWDVPAVLEDISQRLARGERP